MEQKDNLALSSIKDFIIPDKSPKPFPGFVQALRIMLMSYLIIIPIAVITGLIFLPINNKIINLIVKNLNLDIGAILVMFYYYKKHIKTSIRETFFLNRFSPGIIIPIVITITGSHIALSEIDNFFRFLLPMPQFLQDFLLQYLYNRNTLLATTITTVIVGPVTEELMFRGMIMHGFLARYRQISAIILSGILFSLMHLNPWQMIGAFIHGCFFGWILIETYSLFPCIIAHSLNNLIPTIAVLCNIKIPGYFGDIIPTNVFQPWWLDLCGIALTLSGIYIFIRQHKNKVLNNG